MNDDALGTSLRTVAAARLLAMGVPVGYIGRWCDAWDAEAEQRELEMGQSYWEDGIRWIVSQVAAGRPPPAAS